ncbi:hypothetical protein ACP70R_042697 [Stipagrostis hirtigluma subsp. patula]
MAGVAPPAVACLLLLLAAAAAIVVVPVAAAAPPQVFVVGGEARGWRMPIPDSESYNHWADKNRFHVGDFLQFNYDKNDSVLVVSREDYKLCGVRKPLRRFDGGDTRYRLDKTGFAYFISGAPGHCGAGQRMTARVMAPQGDRAPAPAEEAVEEPAMSPGGEDDEGGSYGPPAGSGGGSYSPPSGGKSGGAGGSSSSESGLTAATPPPTEASAAAPLRLRAPPPWCRGSHVVGLLPGALLLFLTA